MDDKIKKAIEFANYRNSLFNIKENLKLKVDTMLAYATNGGLFKSTPELITFVKLILDSGTESVVIIDVNGNPTEITDIQVFYDELLDRYFQATNFYNIEYSKLKKARSVSAQLSDILGKE